MTDIISDFRKFVDLIESRSMACDGPVTSFLEELNAASEEEKKRFTAILAAIYKSPPPHEVPGSVNESQLLDALSSNYWDLRCINVPTGAGDCDVDWIVVEHHMADPQERTVAQAYVDDPRVAIRRALRSIDKNAARCVVCDEVLHDGDSVYYEHGEGGHLHSHCASDDPESFVDVDEVPLKAGDPIPEPFAYSVEKYEVDL